MLVPRDLTPASSRQAISSFCQLEICLDMMSTNELTAGAYVAASYCSEQIAVSRLRVGCKYPGQCLDDDVCYG